MMIGKSEGGKAVLRLTRKLKLHLQIAQKTSCCSRGAGMIICSGFS